MNITEKLAPIRKGLLEFVILKIVAGDKVYVADMLKLLGPTEFATQEGSLYPLLSKLRREELVVRRPEPGWQARAASQCTNRQSCGSVRTGR
jgi:DNA-binding PadR family transcriptional regulator